MTFTHGRRKPREVGVGSRDGALRVAAGKAGVCLSEYITRTLFNEKWCWICRAWQPRAAFGIDRTRWDGHASKCREAHNTASRDRYVPRPLRICAPGKRRVAARDGDKLQARRRVNYLVEAGLIPNPNSVLCTDCGESNAGSRHEYDHYKGYAAEHHETVEAVCSKCHAKREMKRRGH